MYENWTVSFNCENQSLLTVELKNLTRRLSCQIFFEGLRNCELCLTPRRNHSTLRQPRRVTKHFPVFFVNCALVLLFVFFFKFCYLLFSFCFSFLTFCFAFCFSFNFWFFLLSVLDWSLISLSFFVSYLLFSLCFCFTLYFFFRFMAQARSARTINRRGGNRWSVPYSTDREGEVSKIFIANEEADPLGSAIELANHRAVREYGRKISSPRKGPFLTIFGCR